MTRNPPQCNELFEYSWATTWYAVILDSMLKALKGNGVLYQAGCTARKPNPA